MMESKTQQGQETSIPQEVPRRITDSWCVTPTQRKSSRTSRYESKAELQDINRKYKDVECKTEAAQDLNKGETRHESREHHDVPEREDVQCDEAHAFAIERANVS